MMNKVLIILQWNVLQDRSAVNSINSLKTISKQMFANPAKRLQRARSHDTDLLIYVKIKLFENLYCEMFM